jgi:hypothetical protein
MREMLIGIIGTGRNGSTLLSRLLDGLEETYVHPVEENFLSVFDDLARLGKVSRNTGQNCRVKPLRGLERAVPISGLEKTYQVSLDALHRLLKKNLSGQCSGRQRRFTDLLPGPSYLPQVFVVDYLRATAEMSCPSGNYSNYLFKTIETPYIPDYAACFPEMRFIHIVRDPVAVCSSQKRSLMETKGYPATYIGYDWLICMIDKRWIPHARMILAYRDDPRHAVVRYEDLVTDPAREIGRLAGWLDLKAPSRPHVQTIFGDHDFVELDDNPSKAGVRTPREAIPDLRQKFAYKEVLTAREIDLINYKTFLFQERLGYRPSSHPSLARVLVQYARVDGWEWANVKGIGGVFRALFGMIYRRALIF